MTLFFDASWFDARLGERGLDRSAMARAAGVEPADLHRVFTHERAPTGEELQAFARLLEADLVEVTLRGGVASPYVSPDAGADERIASIEARLDAIDSWLSEFERGRKRA
jgi:hypothetical protein